MPPGGLPTKSGVNTPGGMPYAASSSVVDLVPNKFEQPRLLTTAALEVPKTSSAADPKSKYKLKGASLFSGNGRAIFIGILLGGLVISGGGFVFSRHQARQGDLDDTRRFLSVRTRTVTAAHDVSAPPEPLVVQISPELVRVTAIALGHPRLALINGQEVTEGDTVTVRPPNTSVTVALRVVRIAEGAIDLTDGSQTVRARLRIPEITSPAR